MAWVEKLGSGRYRAIYRDHTGKRRSAGTFTHTAAAKRAGNSAEDAARKAGWSSPDAARQTWAAWCEVWWSSRDVAASTLKRDASRRDAHLLPKWGGVELANITEHDVRAWAVRLIREGRSPATAQRCVHLLSASLKSAVDARVLPRNEAHGIRVDKGKELRQRYLTQDEVERIVDHLPTRTDQTVVYLLAYTGCRWGEIAGLHWARVSDDGVLTVAETMDDQNRVIVPWPKGKKPRAVQLAPWLVDRLGERTAGPCGVDHLSGRCQSGLVVTTKSGTALGARNWRRVFDQAVTDAGLTDVWPHLLRHTAASWGIQNGASLAEVGQLLGHRSPQTTQRYAHLIDRANTLLSDLPQPSPRV